MDLFRQPLGGIFLFRRRRYNILDMDIIEKMRKEVFLRRPALGEIAGSYGGEILKDYITKRWEVPGKPPDEDFLFVFGQLLKFYYGDDLAASATAQLIKKPLVSTVDHHGIWGHPIFVNSDLIYSLAFKPGESAVILATESVSLNNTSSWSGSLLCRDNSGDLRRYSFFPDRQKTLPVFSAPAVSGKNIDYIKKHGDGRFGDLLDLLKMEDCPGAENFSAQACHISHRFWQVVFPSAPRAVYLPLETLIINYFIRVFKNPAHILSRMVLSRQGQNLWRRHFGQEHTFMFWGIGPDGRRQALLNLPRESRDVVGLMEKRKIYPSSPLCFTVLLYAGLACAGGFNQTTRLTRTKEKLTALLLELGGVEDFESARAQSAPCKNFAESSLAWMMFNGKPAAPSASDLYFSGRDYYPAYSALAQRLTLGQSLALAMPTIYEVAVPEAKRDKAFQTKQLDKAIFKALSSMDYFGLL